MSFRRNGPYYMGPYPGPYHGVNKMARYPILHSELAKQLLAEGNFVNRAWVLELTSGGVMPEGSRFDKPLQPNPAWMEKGNINVDESTELKAAIKEGMASGTVGADKWPGVSTSGKLPGDATNRAVSNFKFGERSIANLDGVHPNLVQLAYTALSYSEVDFAITDGVRTREEQAKNVAKGVSRTMQSKHLPQLDGYSHAIDACPIGPDGRVCWDWNLIYKVAAAFHKAALALKLATSVRWGGAWDMRLADFGSDPRDFQQACAEYCKRHTGSDLLDGPHYELVS